MEMKCRFQVPTALPLNTAPNIHQTGSQVSPRAILGAVENSKCRPVPEIDPRFLGCPPVTYMQATLPYTSSFSRKLTLVPGASFRLSSVHQTSRMSRTSLPLSSLRRSSSIAALPHSSLYSSLNMCHRLNLKYFSVHHVYEKDRTTCTAPVHDVVTRRHCHSHVLLKQARLKLHC